MPALSARAALLPFALAALSGVTLAATAEPPACVAHGGPTSPHLVELYTSEGCSSCPPAESWLDALSNDARVIALEFHVDYWDGLGWKDRFADARWTARQQALAARSPRHDVYTPEVVLDGNEWRSWPRDPLPPAAAAPLPLDLVVVSGVPLQVRLDSRGTLPDMPPRVYFALVESDLASAVRAGENAGRTLRHTNVVRALAGPVAIGERAELNAPADLLARNAAVVAFVSDSQDAVRAALRVDLAACP